MHETTEVRPRPRPGSIVLGLLVVTIVGTAGYLLGSLRERAESKAPALPVVEQDDREPAWASAILSELAALRDEVRLAKVAPESRTPITAGSTPDVAPRADIARLDALVARLEAATKLSAQAARTPPDPELLQRLGREVSLFEWSAIDGFAGNSAYEEWRNKTEEELTRSHRLWTLEDTLQAYGSPCSSSGTMGSRIVNYAIRTLDPEVSVLVRFWFDGDRVTVVQPDVGSPH